MALTGFVAPASGETVWYLSNGIDKPFFAKLLAAFAQTGAGRDRIIVLQLDNAGWHGPENLPVPDGIRLVYQPHAAPNSSRLSAYGLSSTSLSSTRTLPPSMTSMPLWPSDAASSSTLKTSSKATPTSIGGQNPVIRPNHSNLSFWRS
jgi:hypothetical protein